MGRSPGREPCNAATAILEVAIDAIVSMDHLGLVTEFNPAAEKMFGYARAEALGRALAELIIPSSLRQAHCAGLERYLSSGDGPVVGKRVELTAMRRDGSEFPVDLAICRIPASDPPAFTGFIRDLTEQRRTAEALRVAEERSRRYEAETAARFERERAERAEAQTRQVEQLHARFISMLEATPDFVGFADARTTRILYVNKAGRRMCGVAEGTDVTSQRIADWHPEWANKRLREEALPIATKRGTWNGELAFSHRDGREIPAVMIIMSHRGADGNVDLFSTISRDLSERRQVEEVEHRLVQEQEARAAAEEAVRARDDFVATAGHELKTPLAALLIQIQSMQRSMRAGRPVDVAERLDKLARSGSRLAKLVDQLLDVSRITSGRLHLEPESFELGALLREVVTRFSDESTRAGCSVYVVGDAEVIGCWDRLRIDQVITNLLSNAIKYGRGKPIVIELGLDGESAIVRVVDEGIGIEPEYRDRIFSRFERAVSARDYCGFGLGLWISRRIVEASGGTIDVVSEPGRGSSFTFRLPVRCEESAHADD
jgi:PAS domain S-box-containing protein